MRKALTPHPLETKLPKIIEAYRRFPEPHVPLPFSEEKLMPQEVIARLQRGLDAFAEVRLREDALALAIEERDRLVRSLSALAVDATHVARRHFGPGAKETAALVAPRRERRASKQRCGPPTVVEEVVTTIIQEEEIPEREKSCGGEPQCGAEAPCAGRPPKRGCRATRMPERGVKRGCEAQKGCGSPRKQRTR